MARRNEVGDGDVCPLVASHGLMLVIPNTSPPKQYCPHVAHDGRGGAQRVPSTRSVWPLYGLEESVATYLARIDRAVAQADLPDLSDLEVM